MRKEVKIFLAGAPVQIALTFGDLVSQKPIQWICLLFLAIVVPCIPILMAIAKYKKTS